MQKQSSGRARQSSCREYRVSSPKHSKCSAEMSLLIISPCPGFPHTESAFSLSFHGLADAGAIQQQGWVFLFLLLKKINFYSLAFRSWRVNVMLLKQQRKKRTLTLLMLCVAGGKAAVITGFGGNCIFIHNFNDSLGSGKPLSTDMSYQKEQKPGLSQAGYVIIFFSISRMREYVELEDGAIRISSSMFQWVFGGECSRRKIFTSAVIRKAICRKSEDIWLQISSRLFCCLLKPLSICGIESQHCIWFTMCQKCGKEENNAESMEGVCQECLGLQSVWPRNLLQPMGKSVGQRGFITEWQWTRGNSIFLGKLVTISAKCWLALFCYTSVKR